MPLISPAEQLVEELFAPKAIKVKVGDKEHGLGIADLYADASKLEEIKKGIIKRCNVRGATKQSVKREALHVLSERAIAKVQYDNVLREELRIRNQELKPHQFDLANFYKQAAEKRKKNDAAGKSYKPSADGIGDTNNFRPRISGATKQEMQAIKDGKTSDVVFIDNPDKFYRNAVFDTKLSARDDIRVANQKLDNFLAEGRTFLTKAEEKKLRVHTEFKHNVSNAVQAAGAAMLEVGKFGGRGLISKTDAVTTADFRQYAKTRNDAVYKMLYNLCPGKDRAAYFQSLKNRNQALFNSQDPEAVAMANEYDKMLDDMIAKAEKEDYKTIQEQIEKYNTETLSGYTGKDGKRIGGLESHVEKSDEAHKWMVLCGAFALGPFFPAVSLLPVFGHIISPVLMGGGGFVHNLASMPSNPIFGPFAEIAKICHIPDLLQYGINHIPIISDLADLMDFATRNEVSAGVLEMALPMIGSPVTALGVGAFAVVAGTTQQYMLYTDRRDFMDQRESGIKGLLDQTAAELSSDYQKQALKGEVASGKLVHRKMKAVDLLCKLDENTLQDLGIKFTPEHQAQFNDLKKTGKVSPVQVIQLMSEMESSKPSKEMSDKIQDIAMINFLADGDLNLVKNALTADETRKKSMIAEGEKKSDREYFSKQGFAYDASQSAAENNKRIEEQMVKSILAKERPSPIAAYPQAQTFKQVTQGVKKGGGRSE